MIIELNCNGDLKVEIICRVAILALFYLVVLKRLWYGKRTETLRWLFDLVLIFRLKQKMLLVFVFLSKIKKNKRKKV